MRLFTVIVGLATLLSLGIQLSGLFEEPPPILWYSATFLGGVTLGLAVSVLFSTKLSVSADFRAKQLLGFVLYSATGLLVAILFLLGAVLDDPAQRSDAQKLGSAVSGFLIFLLLFYLNSFFGEPDHAASAALEDDEFYEEEPDGSRDEVTTDDTT